MGKRTLYSLESDIRRILEGNDFISTSDEGGKQWYMNLVTDLANFVQREIEKARKEGEEIGRKKAIHEISKTLDTEITRWRSDEDGEFDVLRIGFRYFRSKDADDYYSSIEAIGEEDFKDYESI